MKSLYGFIRTGFLVLFFTATHLQAQESEIRQVDADFESISVAGNFEVIVYDKPQNGEIELEGAAKDLEKVTVEVKKGRLIIKKEVGLNLFEQSDRTVRVSLDAHNLNSLSLSGSGKITTKGFQEVDQFKANLSGSGNIQAKINAEEVQVLLSGPGDIDLTGEAGHLEIKRSGSGDINAFDLSTVSSKIVGSGSGNVRVLVDKVLKVSSVGSGDVFYKGNPVVEIQSAGSGKVTDSN